MCPIWNLLSAGRFSIIDSIGCDSDLGTFTCLNTRLYLDRYCDLLEEEPIFEDVICDPIIGSYDPNDKKVTPIGEGSPHYIDEGEKLTYKIRFQNVGNDTAFNVRIVDTLPQFLNLSSFRNLTSSHNYSFGLAGYGAYQGRVAKWNFFNIALPDSTTNPVKSIGFVEFEVLTECPLTNCYDLPIENEAHIRFDFNPYITTNTAFNTFRGESPLPVTLLNFSGNWLEEKRAVQLQWTTAEEVNAAHFNLQRSPDGEHFATIAQLPSKGGAGGITHYGFTDENPPQNAQTLYYRLLQTDADGSQTVSKTIAIKPSGEGTTPKVFVNAWAMELNVQNAAAGSQLRLFNASGKAVMNLTLAQNAINVAHLPPGIYFYQIQSPNGEFWTGKVWR